MLRLGTPSARWVRDVAGVRYLQAVVVTNGVDLGYLVAAWIFAAFRVFHSAVHCTVNIVILRFWLYCISALALWEYLPPAFRSYWTRPP